MKQVVALVKSHHSALSKSVIFDAVGGAIRVDKYQSVSPFRVPPVEDDSRSRAAFVMCVCVCVSVFILC